MEQHVIDYFDQLLDKYYHHRETVTDVEFENLERFCISKEPKPLWGIAPEDLDF